jgi:NADPH:quinone reductase-like Zn-dependent oxidoreductase
VGFHFSGAGYMETAAAAAEALLSGNGLGDIVLLATTIAAPLLLPKPELAAEILRVEVVAKSGSCRMATKIVHVTTQYGRVSQRENNVLAVLAASETLVVSCSEPLATAYVYRRLAQAGLEYGPNFRLLRSVKQGAESASALLLQPGEQQRAGFLANPAVLDGCLQLGAFVPRKQDAASGSTFVPAAVEAITFGAATGSAAAIAVACRPAVTIDTEAAITRDHLILGGGGGSIMCRIQGLQSRSTSSSKASASSRAAQPQDMLYEISWAASEALLQEDEAGRAAGIVLSWRTEDRKGLAESAVSALQGGIAAGPAGMRLNTRGQQTLLALSSAGEEHAPGQLWGMMRTVAQENDSLAVSAADEDRYKSNTGGALASLTVLSEAESIPFDGYGRAFLGGLQYLPFMVASRARSAPSEPFQLLPQPRGSLNGLVPQRVLSEVPPQSGHLLVEVKAVGLNFRDVLNVLGMYPGDPGPPGGDCAGVVLSQSQADGNGLAPGQPVFGLAAGSLGSHVHGSASTMVPMPPHLTFEAAATMPTVFVTVEAALVQAGGMRPGERVLVHAAAGGVGLAAMQVVKAAGGVAVATAGSADKRDLLRMLGVADLATSRTLEYVDTLAQLGGIDVVLNTLTSPGFVAASLALLNSGGRFVEISKRDIWSGARIAQGAHLAFLFLYSCQPCNLSSYVQGTDGSYINFYYLSMQSDPIPSIPWLPSTSCRPQPSMEPSIAWQRPLPPGALRPCHTSATTSIAWSPPCGRCRRRAMLARLYFGRLPQARS